MVAHETSAVCVVLRGSYGCAGLHLWGVGQYKKQRLSGRQESKVEYLTVPDVGLLLRALDLPSRPIKLRDEQLPVLSRERVDRPRRLAAALPRLYISSVPSRHVQTTADPGTMVYPRAYMAKDFNE
jgi:hypothetical protein